MDFLPIYEFHQCVQRYHGHYKMKSFVYMLVVLVKKQLQLELSLYTILRNLSVTLYEKTPILETLSIIQPQEPDKGDRRFSTDIKKIQHLIESGELFKQVEKAVEGLD